MTMKINQIRMWKEAAVVYLMVGLPSKHRPGESEDNLLGGFPGPKAVALNHLIQALDASSRE
jgi:hypothetical protein